MAFVLARPPSPPPRDTEGDALSAALHAALQPFSTETGLQPNPAQGAQSPHNSYTPLSDDMQLREKADKGHPFVDISVNSDVLTLRGTGVDVEPALLSGNVVLFLSEPTAIKEISLQFRGKARIPESLALNNSTLTYLVCNHEWSFLEGAKTRAHTLKAGRHLFPFQLHIGGSLPSSLSTSALGGASVSYKLRATVVRPMGFGLTHRDLHAVHPIHIIRGFGAEALEYQQTLEIENTWPDKIMYSIMIPHKAWAAGDRVTAVVKFQPLVKGARVMSVTTMINETVKLTGRGGSQETTRTIATSRHEFLGKDAVCVDEQLHRHRVSLLHHSAYLHSPSRSGSGSGSLSRSLSRNTSGSIHSAIHGPLSPSSSGIFPSPTGVSPGHGGVPLTPVTTHSSESSGLSAGPSRSLSGASSSSLGHTGPTIEVEAHPPSGIDMPDELAEEPSQDVITTLHITVPVYATPGHTLEPIQVSHRIRWSIMIGNLDGHTSELRCSLPIHVLDHRLYEEAHAATLQTRRLLLGAADVEGGEAVGTHGEASDDEDMELPSYPAHVRDRVANAYLPETATMRVTNPWVANGVSPVLVDNHHNSKNKQNDNNSNNNNSQSHSGSSSGLQSPAPMECYPISPNGTVPEVQQGEPNPRSQLPTDPSAQQMHWVSSELLLSLSEHPDGSPNESRAASQTPPEPESRHSSRHSSRFSSRRASRANSRTNSRANSRAASPERSDSGSVSAASSAETYVHSSSTASRNTQGVFQASMKPFTSITGGLAMGLGSGHRSQTSDGLSMTPHHHGRQGHGSRGTSGASTPTSSGANTPALVSSSALHRPHLSQDQVLLHRAFIETPDYEIASRGFLGGGVPPLSSYTGLPSYEEVAEGAALERSRSEPDIAGRVLGGGMTSIDGQLQHSRAPPAPSPPRHSAVS